MKKSIFFVLIALVSLLAFASCGKRADGELYLVKQTYTDKSTAMTVEYFYNEEYKIIKQVSDTGKDSSTVSEYGYDENGYQNYQKVVAESGLVQEVFMENDSEGRVIERKLVTNYNGNVTETLTKIEYVDSNGSYVETSTSGMVTTYTLDEHGNFTSIKSEGLSEQTATYENKYENGLLIESTLTTVTKTKTTKQTIKYEYDDHGNKIKSEIFNEQGDVTVTETFEYSSKPEIIK